MANDTSQATETCSREAGKFFDQAYRACGESFKAALKAQEDSVKVWSEAVGKAAPMPALAGDWVPLAQKNTEDYLHLMESSYRRNAELVKKAVHTQTCGDMSSLEKNSRDLWDASMEVARENLQELVGTNLRVAQSWTDMFKKQSNAAVAAVGNG